MEYAKFFRYALLTGTILLSLPDASYAQKGPITDYLNRMRTQITTIDKTVHVGRDGQQRNINHDIETYKRNIEREIREAKSRVQSRPQPQPLVIIKVYTRKQ
jgi:hypothetical protein